MDLRSAITCFCAAICFYHDKRSPSFTGERRIRRAVLPETFFESACSNGDLLYFICVCQRGVRLASPRLLGSHVKTYSARAPEEAPHFWLIYVIIWLYVLTPFFRYVMQHIPDSVLSGLVAVILIFQILGTYWDTLYYNSIASGILGSFAGVFILGYYLTREQWRRKYFIYGAGILSVCLAVRHIFSGAQYHRYLFNNAPLMVFYTMAVFLFVRQIYVKAETEHFFTKLISRYSFGILLIHWGVLHYLVKQIFHVSPTDFGVIGGSLLMIVLTLFFSLIGAMVLDRTLIHWCLSLIAWIEKKF